MDNPVRKYPAIRYEDTSHAVIDGFRGRQAGSGEEQAAIALNSVHGIVVLNLQVTEGDSFSEAKRDYQSRVIRLQRCHEGSQGDHPSALTLYFVHEYIAIDDIPGLTLFILYFVYNLLEF